MLQIFRIETDGHFWSRILLAAMQGMLRLINPAQSQTEPSVQTQASGTSICEALQAVM